MTPKTRTRVRSRSSWIGAIALSLTVAIGAVGCSPDTLAQSTKAVGDESSVDASEIPQAPDPATIEPMSSATSSAEAGGEISTTGDDIPADAVLPAVQSASAEEPAPQSGDQKLGPRAAMTVQTLPGLTKFGADVTGGGCRGYNASWSTIPDRIAANNAGNWCFQGDVLGAAEIQANFTIDGSKDLLWTHTKIPTIGDNTVACSILDARTWKPQTRSRYACKAEWTADKGHGLNPKPKITLYEKPTVVITDQAEAEQLLTEKCSKNEPTCRFISTKQEVKTQDRAHWHVLHSYQNCGPSREENARHKWSKGVEHKLEHKLAGSATLTIGNPEKLALAIEAKYSRAWELEHTYKASIDVPVVWGWASILYGQESNLHVSGSFEIVEEKRIVRINDTSYMLPLSESWTDETNMTYAAEQLHGFAYPVKCPNEDIVPKPDDEKEHDKEREKLLQSAPELPENPTPDWILAHGGMEIELD
jgi:hypothetical protein